jgi:capsular polysaccharide biosynthesis protein
MTLARELTHGNTTLAMNQERPFDTRASWRSISKRWRVVGVFLVVGLLAAFAYSALSPRRLVAHSLVLLPPAPVDGSTTPTRDMGTETRIATSSPVLERAIRATDLNVSVDDLRQRVAASAVTSSLLEIQVADTSSRRAITFANAVARGYVTYSKQLGAQSGDTLVQALQARASELTAQLNALDAQATEQTAKVSALAPGTPAAASAGAALNALQGRQTSTALDLRDVNQQINSAKLNAAGETEGLRVLEPATSALGPSLLSSALPFLLAALVALAAGCAAALWRDRRDDRARRRQDIAAAIGAPVLASLQARRGSGSDSKAVVNQHGSQSDELTLRHLGRRLANGQETGAGFVVVSLTGDDAAIQIVRRLSEAAAQSGLETALFVPPYRQPLDGLHESTTGLNGATQDNPTIHELHRTLDDAAPNADLAIVLVITDGSKLELPRWSAAMPAVMSVSAGFARRGELAMVSAMMRAASRPFAGVIVTNPDPRDGTSASQLPTTEPHLVPTRITGVARESAS